MRPSTTVWPWGVSLRESADTSSSLEYRPASPAFHTASPSIICTALTPVSPPFRRSTMHCSASSPWKSITSAPPYPTTSALSISQFSGSSISGRRQVTGSDDPASIGNFSRLDASTIHLALLEAVRQVLVVEERNRHAVLLEHLDALLDELVSRIELLPLLVSRVLPVLSDDQDGVHGELAAAAAQRLRDRGIHRKPELLGPRRALVAVRLLVHVERHDLHVRLVPGAVPADIPPGTGRRCAARGTGSDRPSR